MLRLRRLEVQGFRAFGAERQVLDFEKDLAFIYAPNSQGKTSLSEAIEFLLSGHTSRRDLQGSAVREFADALRNAHLPNGQEVVVHAVIIGIDGNQHIVERKLTRDYTAKDSCASTLTVNGATAADVTGIGIPLSQGPLRSSVLMPHCLRYVLQAEPKARSDYFKMLLEVADLDDVRKRISEQKRLLASTPSPTLTTYERCRSAIFAKPLEKFTATTEGVECALGNAIALALGSPNDLPTGLRERVDRLRDELERQRRAAFPIDAFPAPSIITWRPPAIALSDIKEYRLLLSTVDAELARLRRLFDVLIEVPAVNDLKPPSGTMVCPVCSDGTLTAARVAEIRSLLTSSSKVAAAHQRASAALRVLHDVPASALTALESLTAPVLTWSNEEKLRRGYDEVRLAELLGDGGADTVKKWKVAVSEFGTALQRITTTVESTRNAIQELTVDAWDEVAEASATTELTRIREAMVEAEAANSTLTSVQGPLVEALKARLDLSRSTVGWVDLLALAADPTALLQGILKEKGRRRTEEEFDQALKEIDDAVAALLDEKFSNLGGDVVRWWSLMRPDTTTKFASIQRAGTGRRFLDMKAALFEGENHPKPKALRDAVAVFSDSQLNCLGLAAFLARSVRQKCGFIVLDDPFSGSDPDHRTMFIDAVLPKLVQEGVQVLILTHDELALRDAQHIHEHLGVDCFKLGLDDPLLGARITRTKDDLDILLSRASALTKSNSSFADEPRKLAARHLRDAAERFCKMMLVKQARSKGDNVMLSNFDRTLGELIPLVEPLLTLDPSDPGKLRVIPGRLNTGNHDDSPPSSADLKTTCGNLTSFKQRYLP